MQSDKSTSCLLDSKAGTTRSSTPNLPIFSDDDPHGWLIQAEEYFTFHNIRKEAKLAFASFHMTKTAFGWMRELRRNNMLTTWSKFRNDLMERFGMPTLDDKLEELSQPQPIPTIAAAPTTDLLLQQNPVNISSSELPPSSQGDPSVLSNTRVISYRIIFKGQNQVEQVLREGVRSTPIDCSWKELNDIPSEVLIVNLEDKVKVVGVGNVTEHSGDSDPWPPPVELDPLEQLVRVCFV